MRKKQIYFNFPIQLLEGFLVNSEKCLNDIFDYAVAKHALSLEYNGDNAKFAAACDWFGVKAENNTKSMESGIVLIDSLPENSPKVGINKDVFFDYYKNEKSEFEKVCLIGYLGLKSIIQNKTFLKLDNKFWLSRMDGKTTSHEITELSSAIQKYANEYQAKKIKLELSDNWGLVTYSRYTRGFYISFILTLDDLIFQAEKKRKSTNEKQRKEREKQALSRALSRLQNLNNTS